MPTKRLSVGLVAALSVSGVMLLAMSGLATAQEEAVLVSFKNNGTGGQGPRGSLVMDGAGNFYGTTIEDGPATCQPLYPTGCGTVFELSPKPGGGWIQKVLYGFHGRDGWSPAGSLILDTVGNLYGTTFSGGAGGCPSTTGGITGCGTVFELSPGTAGKWTEKVLYSFRDTTEDGQGPLAGLIFDASGNLYGTTGAGGSYHGGTAFELTPAAGGKWKEKLIHEFGNENDGSNPVAGLIADSAGNLYSTTTLGGGTYGYGTVFELTPTSSGAWTETVLHTFLGLDLDGEYPSGGLIFDSSGNLYGTTEEGGAAFGYGTVFEMTPQVGGAWNEAILHSFGYTDGASPMASLTLASDGTLYGTAANGGPYSYNGGTVFELKPATGGGWTYSILHSFASNPNDGLTVYAGLVLAAGRLYGATLLGGVYGSGTVFEVVP